MIMQRNAFPPKAVIGCCEHSVDHSDVGVLSEVQPLVQYPVRVAPQCADYAALSSDANRLIPE